MKGRLGGFDGVGTTPLNMLSPGSRHALSEGIGGCQEQV